MTTTMAIVIFTALALLLVAIIIIINLAWKVKELRQNVKYYKETLDYKDGFLDRIIEILNKNLTITERHAQAIEEMKEELKLIKKRIEEKENE